MAANKINCPSTDSIYGKSLMSLVRFENIGLRYSTGPEILRDVSFELKPGSFHFLTGASGAGKSSLLRLMFLSQPPTRGLVRMFGRDVASLPREGLFVMRRQIGVVFQDYRLFPHLTAFDNVALPLRIAGIEESVIKKDVMEILHWVGLGNHIHSRPLTMSGGEQQRVAIARAVINRPRLILADEPTGNIDERMGMKLLYLFEELNKLGTAIVIATHDENIVRRFGHNVMHIHDGRLTVRSAGEAEAA